MTVDGFTQMHITKLHYLEQDITYNTNTTQNTTITVPWSLMGVKGLNKKMYFILLLSVDVQMLVQCLYLRNCTPTPPLIQL